MFIHNILYTWHMFRRFSWHIFWHVSWHFSFLTSYLTSILKSYLINILDLSDILSDGRTDILCQSDLCLGPARTRKRPPPPTSHTQNLLSFEEYFLMGQSQVRRSQGLGDSQVQQGLPAHIPQWLPPSCTCLHLHSLPAVLLFHFPPSPCWNWNTKSTGSTRSDMVIIEMEGLDRHVTWIPANLNNSEVTRSSTCCLNLLRDGAWLHLHSLPGVLFAVLELITPDPQAPPGVTWSSSRWRGWTGMSPGGPAITWTLLEFVAGWTPELPALPCSYPAATEACTALVTGPPSVCSAAPLPFCLYAASSFTFFAVILALPSTCCSFLRCAHSFKYWPRSCSLLAPGFMK